MCSQLTIIFIERCQACKKIQLNKLKNDAEPTTDILFPACTAESERLQMRRGILNNRIDTGKFPGSISSI